MRECVCDKEFDVTRKCVVFLKHFDHFFLKLRAIVDHRLRKSRSLFPSSRLAFYIRDRIRDTRWNGNAKLQEKRKEKTLKSISLGRTRRDIVNNARKNHVRPHR